MWMDQGWLNNPAKSSKSNYTVFWPRLVETPWIPSKLTFPTSTSKLNSSISLQQKSKRYSCLFPRFMPFTPQRLFFWDPGPKIIPLSRIFNLLHAQRLNLTASKLNEIHPPISPSNSSSLSPYLLPFFTPKLLGRGIETHWNICTSHSTSRCFLASPFTSVTDNIHITGDLLTDGYNGFSLSW